jgi:hypothetical protein
VALVWHLCGTCKAMKKLADQVSRSKSVSVERDRTMSRHRPSIKEQVLVSVSVGQVRVWWGVWYTSHLDWTYRPLKEHTTVKGTHDS